MRLFGSTTSPFVRRVRIVADELGLTPDWVDTNQDAGQAELRRLSPIWKVPVLETTEGVLFDSHVIIDWLLERHGNRVIRRTAGDGRWRELNLHNAIDAALDSAINHFYLTKRDGADPQLPYLAKQLERVAAILGWMERELHGGYFTADPRLGLTELALATALDWMIFRQAYPVDRHPGLMAFRAVHASRPSFARTTPHA